MSAINLFTHIFSHPTAAHAASGGSFAHIWINSQTHDNQAIRRQIGGGELRALCSAIILAAFLLLPCSLRAQSSLGLQEATPAAEAPAPASAPEGFAMAIRTNMLYDALLVPNLGAEFSLGRGWSLGADGLYAWWSNDTRHRYWRIAGGELTLRRYFRSPRRGTRLSGHHLGLYGQAFKYDFEFGGKGDMSDFTYGGGLEYGYSLPVGRRINIDFTIGVGFLRGKYKEYEPMDGHYVWQKTSIRNFFGPTRAEVSLVWLLGRRNANKKGGER